MITSEHHDSALSSPGILFVFLSIHVVFLISFSLYSRESREKRRDIKLNKRERERDGRGGGRKYLLRISLTVCCMLMSSRVSTRGTHHHPQHRRTPSHSASRVQSSHWCLFMGAAQFIIIFFFSLFFFLVYFNGFPQVKWI